MANRKITDLPNLTTPADADLVPFVDASNTTESAQGTSVKVLWSNIKATLKTYFDTLYKFTTLAGYGISDTKANFDTALSDGNFLYDGDVDKAYIDALNVDADTLDSLDSTQFLRSDVADTKTAGALIFNDNIELLIGNTFDVGNAGLRISGGGAGVAAYLDMGLNISIRDMSDFSQKFLLERIAGNFTNAGTITSQGTGTNSFSGQVTVPADAYDAGWNGDNTVPTKNDVYDKIESLNIATFTQYKALITQTGTGAPTATVLHNTLGGTPTWARTSAGIYTLTLTGAFSGNVNIHFGSNENIFINFIYHEVTSANVLTFYFHDGNTNLEAEVSKLSLNIEIY